MTNFQRLVVLRLHVLHRDSRPAPQVDGGRDLRARPVSHGLEVLELGPNMPRFERHQNRGIGGDPRVGGFRFDQRLTRPELENSSLLFVASNFSIANDEPTANV
jgi:hypothetical protein